jgi:hypothetical protein
MTQIVKGTGPATGVVSPVVPTTVMGANGK